MGRRAGTETVAKLVVAFLRHPRWSQKELERVCGVRARAIRRALASLEEAGVRLSKSVGRAGVVWRAEPSWLADVTDAPIDGALLARYVARLPRTEEREAVLERLLASSLAARPLPNERPQETSEATLAALEDACWRRHALRLGYFSASRGEHGIRVLSVQRIAYGDRTRFAAFCHARRELLWFRADRVTHPEPVPSEKYEHVDAAILEQFLTESLDGFHGKGPAQRCEFEIAVSEARWALRAIPTGGESAIVRHTATGAHVVLVTAGLMVLARYLVGLGGACRIAAPEALRDQVAALAAGALAAGRARAHKGSVRRAGRIGQGSPVKSVRR
ncbi:MAG TPA: WYL domain-containing protein [Polyangiaceae bacterium]